MTPMFPIGTVVRIPAGTRGLDCNSPIDLEAARAFYERGYRFVCRYVRRSESHPYDLSAAEIQRLFDAGLAVMPVQHVAPPGWRPTLAMGREYGNTAAAEIRALGVPSGVTAWCDLEGVRGDVLEIDVAGYAQAWFSAVRSSAYSPGLYVGFDCGLSEEALYHQLSFQHYWSAYNAQVAPVVRGFQMRQHEAKHDDVPAGLRFAIDTDVVQLDKLGGLPTAFAPLGWSPV